MKAQFIFMTALYNLNYQTEKLLKKKYLDWRSGTGCDEMT